VSLLSQLTAKNIHSCVLRNVTQECVLHDREVGTASSWSLSRLDSLAEEVKSCFMAQHTSLPDLSSDQDSDPTLSSSSPDSDALLDRQSSHSTASSSGEIHDHKRQSADDSSGHPSEDDQHRAMTRLSHNQDPVVWAMQQYPMQTVAALNTVLFERHGYNRMQLHGNPRWVCGLASPPYPGSPCINLSICISQASTVVKQSSICISQASAF